MRSHRSSRSASRFDRQLAGQLGAHGAESAESSWRGAVVQIIGLVFALRCTSSVWRGQVARDFVSPFFAPEPMMKRRGKAGAGAKPQTLRI